MQVTGYQQTTMTKGRRVTSRRRRRRVVDDKKFSFTIQSLRKLAPAQRRRAMEIANNKFIRHLSSQVKKLKRAKVNTKLRRRMKLHSKDLRKLSNGKTPITVKRKVLTQRGGFLPLLLAALPALGSIIGGVISRT